METVMQELEIYLNSRSEHMVQNTGFVIRKLCMYM